MPPERQMPGSPGDWLRRAQSDLALAKVPLPAGALYEDLCFHAQQAAEKAIKAVYRAHKREFRYTHDLAELLNGLEGAGIDVPEEVQDVVELTGFAWEARYPGMAEPASAEEYKRAVAPGRACRGVGCGTRGREKGMTSRAIVFLLPTKRQGTLHRGRGSLGSQPWLFPLNLS